MIKTENYTINGVNFVRTYSDANRYVVREGISYEEACDPAEFGRAYTEGDPIVSEEESSELQDKAEAYDILTGVVE